MPLPQFAKARMTLFLLHKPLETRIEGLYSQHRRRNGKGSGVAIQDNLDQDSVRSGTGAPENGTEISIERSKENV